MNKEKLLRKFIAAAVLEGKMICGFQGTVLECKAMAEALYATRKLDKALMQSEDLSFIKEALSAKRVKASAFSRVFGFSWPA